MKKILVLLTTLFNPVMLFAMEDYLIEESKRAVSESFSAIGMSLLWLCAIGFAFAVAISAVIFVVSLFKKTFLSIKGATEKEWGIADGIMLGIVALFTGGFGLFGGGKKGKK
jgi:hypothetical protein